MRGFLNSNEVVIQAQDFQFVSEENTTSSTFVLTVPSIIVAQPHLYYRGKRKIIAKLNVGFKADSGVGGEAILLWFKEGQRPDDSSGTQISASLIKTMTGTIYKVSSSNWFNLSSNSLYVVGIRRSVGSGNSKFYIIGAELVLKFN